jgi:predicted metal-dependent enzyme (double-stranded beta helix superfamily)
LSVAPRFDPDELVQACISAAAEEAAVLAVREVLEAQLADGAAVRDVLQPGDGGLTLLHNTDDLTVLHAVWPAGMTLFPHNHAMWAVIGVYEGREDNTYFRRAPDDRRRLVDAGGTALEAGDVLLLGDDAIHSVHNPLDRFTAAIHVYGGDFVRRARSQWGPGERVERPYSYDFVLQEFAAARERAGRAGGGGH